MERETQIKREMVGYEVQEECWKEAQLLGIWKCTTGLILICIMESLCLSVCLM